MLRLLAPFRIVWIGLVDPEDIQKNFKSKIRFRNKRIAYRCTCSSTARKRFPEWFSFSTWCLVISLKGTWNQKSLILLHFTV